MQNEYNDSYGDSDVDNNNEYDDLSEGDGNDDDRRTIMTTHSVVTTIRLYA